MMTPDEFAQEVYEEFVRRHGHALGGSWDNLHPGVRRNLPDLLQVALEKRPMPWAPYIHFRWKVLGLLNRLFSLSPSQLPEDLQDRAVGLYDIVDNSGGLPPVEVTQEDRELAATIAQDIGTTAPLLSLSQLVAQWRVSNPHLDNPSLPEPLSEALNLRFDEEAKVWVGHVHPDALSQGASKLEAALAAISAAKLLLEHRTKPG